MMLHSSMLLCCMHAALLVFPLPFRTGALIKLKAKQAMHVHVVLRTRQVALYLYGMHILSVLSIQWWPAVRNSLQIENTKKVGASFRSYICEATYGIGTELVK